ncbi:permease [Streptococcus dentapri]|uniref:Permease n=1 Tax=Streptococcus dentapri TaxID=573564 RepID=A0ABV8D0Y7_9STRE
MSEKKINISPPKEVVDQLSIQDGQQLPAILDTKRLLIERREVKEAHELPSWTFFLTTGLAALFFYLITTVEGVNQVNLTGDYSIMFFVLVLAGLLGVIFFSIHFVLNRKLFLGEFDGRVFWRMFPIILASFIAIMLTVLLGFSWLLGQVFNSASFDRITSTIIFAVMTYAFIFLASQLAKQIRASWLTSLFTVIISSGVLISMAANGSRQWWQTNLSFLGTDDASASWGFNLTLILSGFILLALVDYLFVALRQRYGKSWRLLILRILLSLLSLDLAAVGYFPNNINSHAIHIDVSNYLVYIIIILVFGVRWLLPNITRDFLIMSYVIGASLVFLATAFRVVHYLSLTAFEMSAFVLAFTWLASLINRLEVLLMPEKKIIYISVFEE